MPKPRKPEAKRSLFRELVVDAMREHREGRLTLRTHHVEPISLPEPKPRVVRETRESLHMSRQVFAFKLGVNPRTLERWEQGRSKPNEQAAALIWLVRKYPDTLERLESLSVSAWSPASPPEAQQVGCCRSGTPDSARTYDLRLRSCCAVDGAAWCGVV